MSNENNLVYLDAEKSIRYMMKNGYGTERFVLTYYDHNDVMRHVRGDDLLLSELCHLNKYAEVNTADLFYGQQIMDDDDGGDDAS